MSTESPKASALSLWLGWLCAAVVVIGMFAYSAYGSWFYEHHGRGLSIEDQRPPLLALTVAAFIGTIVSAWYLISRLWRRIWIIPGILGFLANCAVLFVVGAIRSCSGVA